jgi:hypothetical protein
MHFTDVMLFACIKQDPLGAGCFTRIDVRHDTEVAVQL